MNVEDLPEIDYPSGDGGWSEYDWQAILVPAAYQEHSYTAGDSERKVADDFPLIEEISGIVTWYADSPEGYGSQNFLGLFVISGPDDCMFIDGWCDTTGWDCQSGVQVFFGSMDYLCSSVITEENMQYIEIERPQSQVL